MSEKFSISIISLAVATISVVMVNQIFFAHQYKERKVGPYPFLTTTDFTNRAIELDGKKVCAQGTYTSGWEEQNLVVGQFDVWTDLKQEHHLTCSSKNKVQTCTGDITVCGTFASKAAAERDPGENINGFILERGCCGHLSGWDYEIDED